MALTQKKISKAKQARLAASLIAIIGITAAVAYFGMFKKPSPISQEELNLLQSSGKTSDQRPSSFGKSSFESISELNKNLIFKKLKQFGSWPLSLEPKGKSQPFVEIKLESQ